MKRLLVGALLGGALVAGGFVLRDFLDRPGPSELASPEAAAARKATLRRIRPAMLDLLSSDVERQRKALDEHFYGPKIEEARRLYAVVERPLEIEGIYTEVFEPEGGIPERNADRLLINLHGGAFSVGARTEGRLESIPVAAVAGMRVVSVDYRQGPEHRFPAASEDVATVYRHFLEQYPPGNIGIFGCSAGGMLTGQATAWLDAQGLPRPGAIGIFCAGAGRFGVGDAAVISETFGSRLGGGEIAYFEDADWQDPLVAPIEDAELLSRFPPTLIITSTRDGALSSALMTHQRLVAAGAETRLHVYEGLDHYFFADTGLPESLHVFDVIARFFDTHLAR
ncbi:MAG: alpha/beta hydrolase fold domain-containing protein [Deltaproteobacteria bacterium]|jgi:acetyl esterase/lipase|nr:alpha/beta hydrolase fold domain-containing protein [Deltaproteobacteria bacterium]